MSNYKVFQKDNTQKTHIHIVIKPNNEHSFKQQLNSILKQFDHYVKDLYLSLNDLVYAKVFVSDILNQKEDLHTHIFFRNRLNNCAVSIIEQPPLDQNKINILLWFIKDHNGNKYKIDNVFYFNIGGCTHIFQNILFSKILSGGIDVRTRDIFQQHKHLLQNEDTIFSDNCVRTWLYLRDIDRDYPLVVEGRNTFFEQNNLNKNTHYIASTGIQGCGELIQESIIIDFYSIRGLEKEQIKYLQALDSLNPTHEYGVAFERGVSITFSKTSLIFISGTASIDKFGNCINIGNTSEQLKRIFFNIQSLLKDAISTLDDIAQMIIYVRDISLSSEILQFLIDNGYDTIPYVIVLAKVCRPLWLVEIECIAIKQSL